MSLSVEFHVRSERLEALVRGEYDPDAVVREFGTALEHCRRHGTTSMLVDYRTMKGRGSATLEILYATRVSQLYHEHLEGGGRPLRFAYLGSGEFVKNWQPGVELARAQGLEIMATTDEAEARRWLEA
jgi:hypothetical protein